jgi:hypothetical protein
MSSSVFSLCVIRSSLCIIPGKGRSPYKLTLGEEFANEEFVINIAS